MDPASGAVRTILCVEALAVLVLSLAGYSQWGQRGWAEKICPGFESWAERLRRLKPAKNR